MPPLRWCGGFEVSTKRASDRSLSRGRRQQDCRHAGRARIHFRPRRRLVVRPALSAAVAHLVVLGRQYRARTLRCRTYPADDACVRPVGRRVSDLAAVCRRPSGARLADHPQARGDDDAARVHRLLRLQHDGLLRPAIHHRDQRLAAAIDRAAVRRAVDFCAVRRPPDLAASQRYLRLAHRRRRHHLPRQSRDPARHRVQPRRHLVRDRAGVLRLLHGHACASGRRSIRCRSSLPGWPAARCSSFRSSSSKS